MKIVTLVGSVDQEVDWRFYAQALTKRGYVVFEAGSYDKTATPETWNMVTKVHQRKIELCDIVAFISKLDGSLGDHSLADLEYARKHKKEIVPAASLVTVSTEQSERPPKLKTQSTGDPVPIHDNGEKKP